MSDVDSLSLAVATAISNAISLPRDIKDKVSLGGQWLDAAAAAIAIIKPSTQK